MDFVAGEDRSLRVRTWAGVRVSILDSEGGKIWMTKTQSSHIINRSDKQGRD